MCPENIVVMVMNKTYFLPLQNMVVMKCDERLAQRKEL